MENWTVHHEDRPHHLRPMQSSFAWPATLVVAAFAAALGYYYYSLEKPTRQPQPVAEKRVEEKAPPARPTEVPAVQHPIAPPPAAAGDKPLPALEASDTMMRDTLSSLMGTKPFREMVVPTDVVRRIVATVDNLPRPTAPRRAMPLNPVPGAFAVAREADGAPESATIHAANFSRYIPYVRVLESTDTNMLVFSYVRAYPLFQRAYEELGYSGQYFNDRLIAAIDDMLAAPEIDEPVRVVRSKVLYTFEDEDLENRSAGQKMLIRMGSDNAARVKAKLREIRQALATQTDRKK
ncbi:MAG TPA: DUF3014 domain-containing protein [Burkholderiales bacterium]|nr:DUF3014 domain-containing protein [Burkholderiales bacterium]